MSIRPVNHRPFATGRFALSGHRRNGVASRRGPVEGAASRLAALDPAGPPLTGPTGASLSGSERVARERNLASFRAQAPRRRHQSTASSTTSTKPNNRERKGEHAPAGMSRHPNRRAQQLHHYIRLDSCCVWQRRSRDPAELLCRWLLRILVSRAANGAGRASHTARADSRNDRRREHLLHDALALKATSGPDAYSARRAGG
jgi:hypothetical protein